jgi:hypothetical protein
MLLFFLLFPIMSFSHIIMDDVATVEKFNFSFPTVCNKMVSHESPLIEIVSGTALDCMGREVSVAEFCDRELAADPYYIRAYVDKEKKQVVCQTGKKVLFKYLCVKLTDKKFCNNEAQKNCLALKEKLAKRLELIHASQVKNDKGVNQLNCFYEAQTLNK